MPVPTATFGKEERLKSRREIGRLFSEGRSIQVRPVKGLWLPLPSSVPVPFQFAVAVPKRNFRKAVDRNLIKRRMREAIRRNKFRLMNEQGMKYGPVALLFLYTGSAIPDYTLIEDRIGRIMERFKEH